MRAAHHKDPRPERIELTRRERQVFDLRLQKKTYFEITEILGISMGTVKLHIQHANYKLRLKSASQLEAAAHAALKRQDSSPPPLSTGPAHSA